MGNALTFILKLQDMLTPGMRQAAAISQTASNQITAQFEKINTGGKRMAASVDELRARLAAINKVRFSTTVEREFNIATKAANKLERQIDTLENKGKNRSGGGLFGMLAGRFAPAAMLAGAVALGTTSVHAAMNYGATSKSFEVLTGSPQKGRELAGSLNDLQQKTILGPEVFQAAQTLMGFGVTADKVMKIEKELGDVSMGNKEKFQALTLAFSQTQAAGKLMGQDLLQYINAGFNPLQTMSEKWQQFGFKQKVTVGQLKDMMEKGTISSQMVAKAFEVATSKGGKFADMMDTIGKTSYGYAQILSGSWENFKIQAGNVLMPVANALMDMASKTLDLITPTKSATQALTNENLQVNGLVHEIMNLNIHNAHRKELLDQLVSSYPDWFKNINTENATNKTLLDTLNKVNAAYRVRLSLTTNQAIYDKNNADYNKSKANADQQQMVLDLLRMGHVDEAKAYMTAGQKFDWWRSFGNVKEYEKLYAPAIAKNNTAAAVSLSKSNTAKLQVDYNTALGNLPDYQSKIANYKELVKSVGANKAGQIKKLVDSLTALSSEKSQDAYTQGFFMSNFNRLQKLLPAANTDDTGNAGAVALGKSKADSINNGGQRVITINIGKQIEKMEVHVLGDKEAGKEVEGAIREALRRVVNSMNGVVS